MASTEPPPKSEAPPPPPEAAPKSADPPPLPPPAFGENYFSIDVALRILLFAASLVAVVVAVTSKQSEIVNVPGTTLRAKLPAKFNHSPALIYFVAALSVAGLYGIITTLASVYVTLKPDLSKKFLLHFAFWDVLILGIVASATGAAGAVGYIGLKGNSHVGWTKVCNVYDKFCQHLAASIAISLFAAILLVLLSYLSTYSLFIRIRN